MLAGCGHRKGGRENASLCGLDSRYGRTFPCHFFNMSFLLVHQCISYNILYICHSGGVVSGYSTLR